MSYQGKFERWCGLLRVALVLLFVLSIPSSANAEIETDENGNLVEFTHATMSDGIKIALVLSYPEGFDPDDATQQWPTVLEMSGYPRQARPAPHEPYGGLYVAVNASLRGTGASEGEFAYMSERSIQDGYEIIENWIVKQPWSNGKVGIHGHSWSGLTGFRIAATNPPHLEAVVVSGLFDDSIRGIAAIGGIRNIGFPVSWTSNFDREDGVFGSDEAAAGVRKLSEDEAAEIKGSRGEPDRTLQEPQDEVPSERPATYRELAANIEAPIYLMHSYQDEQTGPTGVWLFDYLPEDTPKSLLICDGHHDIAISFIPLRRAWYDYWLRGEAHPMFPNIGDPDSRVQVFFDVQNQLQDIKMPLVTSDFPIPDTQWERHYFAADGSLSTSAPEAGDESTRDSYEVRADAADLDLDSVAYTRTFDEPAAICGPIVVSLWASSTTPDTDFFVTLSDIAPDGRERALQRGMLRASLRDIDEAMSRWMDVSGEKTLLRPHLALTNPQPLEPGKPYRFEIEVFPVGHIFRAGHTLSLKISQPPVSDPVPYPRGQTGYQVGSYMYESKLDPATVTIYRGADYPSSVLLPMLPTVSAFAEEIPASLDKLWTTDEEKEAIAAAR